MFGCLFVLAALISPRLAFLLIWLFSDRISIAFDNLVIPLLGFIFLPVTSVVYVLVYDPQAGVNGLGWFLVVFAFLVDLGAYSGSRYSNRKN
ncbi:MAG: hypothetical protein Q7K29_07880 [Thermoleophilia bacterium]|nr:hypothetical protein [Thermoleophilia bacterium]